MSEQPSTRCGFVAIVGRPNVGKSTLMNHLIGEKVSITSRKAQTTRHQILGIKTLEQTQMVFIDTPGLHIGQQKAINRYMNRAARSALADVDAVIFMASAMRWTEEDEYVLKLLTHIEAPVFLVINKVDKISDKKELLPFIDLISQQREFAAVYPISAKHGDNVPPLQDQLFRLMPSSPHYFPDDQVTDKSIRFMTAEIIREKLFRLTGQELPYSTTVEIEEFVEDGKLQRISALILVERAGQKKIVIGKQGEKLKEIGCQARLDIEKILGRKVFLRLWIKVKSGWSDDERALRSLGYSDD